MLIEYVVTKSRREVRDSTGRALIKRKIARLAYPTEELKPEGSVEISGRTGKPKRQYKRRDLRPKE
jgi:hypothetical protein